MKLFILTVAICLILSSSPMASAAHYVIGTVNDAADGTSPDGFSIALWNPEKGYKDRIIETIGPNGSLGTQNLYMFDCHRLSVPCQTGDTLKIKVVKSMGYTSEDITVVISNSVYDLAGDILLDKKGKHVINRIVNKQNTKHNLKTSLRLDKKKNLVQ